VSDGKGKVYVNIEDKSEVWMINVKTWKVEQTWSNSPGKKPIGLALDNETHRLFSATDKLMVILDAETGKIITTVPTGGVLIARDSTRVWNVSTAHVEKEFLWLFRKRTQILLKY
jgi:hypothetical protein